MPYLTDEEYNDLEKELTWYKSLHSATMMRTWDEVAFELRAQNAELLAALKAITERAEAVSDGIHVEKRSEGVSQAQHARHMANHLKQHAKIARATIAKAEGR